MTSTFPFVFRGVRRSTIIVAGSLTAAATIFASLLLAPTASSAQHSATALQQPHARPAACSDTHVPCPVTLTVRRFIATAVQRENVGASFELVTPELRNGLTKKEWASGNIPIVLFPDVNWRAFSLRFNDAAAGVSYYFVHLRSKKQAHGEAEFWIGLKHDHDRLLVSYFAPVVVFGAPMAV